MLDRTASTGELSVMPQATWGMSVPSGRSGRNRRHGAHYPRRHPPTASATVTRPTATHVEIEKVGGIGVFRVLKNDVGGPNCCGFNVPFAPTFGSLRTRRHQSGAKRLLNKRNQAKTLVVK
jgi:hypothetical protein